jgi:plastocyanin
MRPRKIRLVLAATLLPSVLFVLLPAIANSVTTPVEAVNEGGGIYGETHRWSPSAETVISGSVVTFRNQTAVPHGVHWISVPIEPKCTGVPVGTTSATGSANWSGSCTFEDEGTYTFYCTIHGVEMTGTVTVPGTPQATTEPPREVSPRGATLAGAIDPKGEPTEYHFQYGTAGVSEHTTGSVNLGASDFTSHPVSAAVSGLSPGTEYKARLIATYGAGKTEVLGSEKKFTTPAITAPSVTTEPASGLSETAATLKGSVNTGGEATEYDFEYGTDESYGKATEVKMLAAAGGSQSVSATIAGLTPGTTYHYRLVAKNPIGPGVGKDATFNTSTPTPSEPPPSPPPSPPSPQGTPPPPPPTSMASAKLEESLLPVVEGSLKLKAPAHGSSVRGSIEVSPVGAGGRLAIDLIASSASLARRVHSKLVVVGRLVRGSVVAGKVSFSVALNARGKSALRRHHKLALTVKVTLTPPGGQAMALTRKVVLRA